MRKFKVTKSITNRDNEILVMYLKDISHYPLITHEEEIELATKGDKKSKDKLVTSNLRFVVSVAKQYQNQGLGLMDLINEGNCGLIEAAERYNPEKGVKFISYAVWWIRQAIIHALQCRGKTVRIPTSQSLKISKIIKAINSFEQENGRKPSDEEIAELVDIDAERIDYIMSGNTKCVSIETPVNEEGTLEDVIPNYDSPLPDYNLDKESEDSEISDKLSDLTIREHDIILLLFGLNGTQTMTNEEIGRRFNLTAERVRQIAGEALEKLSKTWNT